MYISVFVSFLKSVVSSFPSENGHIKKFSKKINYYMLWPTPLQIELNHLRKVYVEINDYPSKTVENIIKNELEKENVDITNKPQTNTTDNSETKLQLFLPFSGKQGIQLLSKMKKQLKKRIPSNVKTCITYEGTKLSTQFPVKDRTKFEHRHNIVYFSYCANATCNETYVGETDRRIKERKGAKVHIY